MKRTSGCWCTTDSTLPTAAPTPPEQRGLMLGKVCRQHQSNNEELQPLPHGPAPRPPPPPPLTGDHQLRGHALVPSRRLLAASLAPQQRHGGCGSAGCESAERAEQHKRGSGQLWQGLSRRSGSGADQRGMLALSSQQRMWALPLLPPPAGKCIKAERCAHAALFCAQCRPQGGFTSCCPCWQRAAARQRRFLMPLS